MRNKTLGFFLAVFLLMLVAHVGILYAEAKLPYLGIKELFIFQDGALISYETKPGEYLLWDQNIKRFEYLSGNGNAKIYEKRVIDENTDSSYYSKYNTGYYIEQLPGLKVEVIYSTDKKISGRIIKYEPDKKLVILTGNNSDRIITIDSDDIKEILLLEPLNTDVKKVATITGTLDSLFSYITSYDLTYRYYSFRTPITSDIASATLKLDVDNLINGKGIGYFSISFPNIYGKLNNTPITFASYNLVPSYDAPRNYVNTYRAEASSYKGTETGNQQTTVIDISEETIFKTKVQYSEYGDYLTLPINSETVYYNFKNVWNTYETEPTKVIEIKSSATTFPSSRLVLLKNGIPYAISYTKNIYPENYTEVTLKPIKSIKTTRNLQVSNNQYKPTNGLLESQDYKVELTFVNIGKTDETINVREYINSNNYYSIGKQRYTVISVSGVQEYTTDIEGIKFNIKIESGKTKSVTLQYRVYYI